MSKEINPDHPLVNALRDEWPKIAAMLLWKLVGTKTVTLTAEDIRAMTENFAPGSAVIVAREHQGCLHFSVVPEAQARLLAEMERERLRQQGGKNHGPQ